MNTFAKLEAVYGNNYDKEIQRQMNLLNEKSDTIFYARFIHWLTHEAPRKFRFDLEKRLLASMPNNGTGDNKGTRNKLNYTAIEFNIFKTHSKGSN